MNGLEFYQIVAISAMCAVGILSMAALFGATVAHFVLREPRPTTEANRVKPVSEMPAPAIGPRVAVG